MSDSGSPEQDLLREQQERDWREHEAESLAKGRCPDSGLVLHMLGEGWPGTASCDFCDCFGYDPDQVKVHPRPLHVVRWKVTRRRCMSCKRSYADNTDSSMCWPCLREALGPDDLWLGSDDPFGVPVVEREGEQ